VLGADVVGCDVEGEVLVVVGCGERCAGCGDWEVCDGCVD
jgi:hypothetical protein